ncbi:hypothetical protein HYH02_007318 [Chlamydomonas schloesseri]|uniref:Deubiquitinating enzyme MINDY-3/4 conserved domain-containing protein n=1 Tax=Chlamydomonas schloesseri TaxID=2026947 RepID=A0A836B537_9CHLO|nr:hypothetical protein HYH02_007318 [Chlamydomonas schloesseri]|eukprot:KAG2447862.1 hypothetical protein HYH02_007318 [Chlamydomonas schloesseri]
MAKVNTWSDGPAAQAPRPVAKPAAGPRGDDPEDASAPVGAASMMPRRPSAPGLASAPGGLPPPRQGFAMAAPTSGAPPAGTPRRPDGASDSSPAASRPVARLSAPGMPHSASASALRGPGLGSGSGSGTAAGASPAPRMSTMMMGTPNAVKIVGGPTSGPGAMSATAPPRAPAARPAGGANELVLEDCDDEFGNEDDAGGHGASMGAAGFATMRISGGPSLRKPGTPISPDTMRQLKTLLWGGLGQPPPSWKQGFFFNAHAGLQFGLVQKLGGPCGVLAAVQAHILAALHSPATGFNTTPRMPEQLSALTTAIAEILWDARMGPHAVLVLPEGEAGGAASKLGYDQLCRTLTSHTASSREALVDLVRSALPLLMAEEGWGVPLLVMSAALSRGIANVRADMDEPNNSLMGMHGYCTQELVHLLILGSATSNVFDGNKQLDGTTTLKGVSRKCRLGMLTLFEWYKYVEVGASLKSPSLPVWVVCSESHFTVLFAADKDSGARCLRDALPFDLVFYDELANMDSVLRLSVSKDPSGGWTAKMGTTIGDRGKCEGQNIPPLECVIETRWPGVKVNWNGHDPIL